ncbi:MAG: tetratricopeptide repeat protein, partial [Planctomycetes bacterium]|nr:tetratricopeptide repeat protein [Planctomycetota bacterium]
AYWYAGDHEHAREYFLQELRTNPGDLDVIFDFGLFLLEKGEIESAKEKFHRILEFNPTHAGAIFYTGEVALNLGDPDRAMDFYDSALRYDDTLSGPYYRLAQHALNQGKYQKARAYLLSELRNSIDNADLLVSMGSMFLNMAGEQKETCEFGDSVEQSVKDMACEPDMDHAVHCLFQAVEINDTHTEAYYYLGLASAFKGYWEDACDFFDHALDCDPDHTPVLMAHARVSAIRGHFDMAREKLHHATAVSPDMAGLRGLRLEIMLRQTLGTLAPLASRFKGLSERFTKK